MIFPDWGTAPDTAPEAALPLFREWAVDWKNGCFALRRGEPYLVSGDEALKIWAARALRPESQRFRYTAWSADYGNELTLLLGGCVDQGILGGGRILLLEEGEPGGGPVHRAHRL